MSVIFYCQKIPLEHATFHNTKCAVQTLIMTFVLFLLSGFVSTPVLSLVVVHLFSVCLLLAWNYDDYWFALNKHHAGFTHLSFLLHRQ